VCSRVKTRGKRKLGHDDKPAASTTQDLPSDNEDEDFRAIAQNLIVAAIDDRAADEAAFSQQVADVQNVSSLVVLIFGAGGCKERVETPKT